MKGLVITTDNLMRIEELTAPVYKSIGRAVGGYIEVVHPKGLIPPYCMVVNEEGFVDGERDFIGLDDDDISKLATLASAASCGCVKWESEVQ